MGKVAGRFCRAGVTGVLRQPHVLPSKSEHRCEEAASLQRNAGLCLRIMSMATSSSLVPADHWYGFKLEKRGGRGEGKARQAREASDSTPRSG